MDQCLLLCRTLTSAEQKPQSELHICACIHYVWICVGVFVPGQVFYVCYMKLSLLWNEGRRKKQLFFMIKKRKFRAQWLSPNFFTVMWYNKRSTWFTFVPCSETRKKTQCTLGQSIFSNSEECFPLGLIISLVCPPYAPSFPRPHRVLLHCLLPSDPFPLWCSEAQTIHGQFCHLPAVFIN